MKTTRRKKGDIFTQVQKCFGQKHQQTEKPCHYRCSTNPKRKMPKASLTVYHSPPYPPPPRSQLLHRRVPPPTPAALHRIEHPPDPILEQVWNVAERVRVREQIPAAGAIPVVVEPRPKDEIRRDGEEDPIPSC